MQGGVYKRRLPKCFHAAPSCFRTPPLNIMPSAATFHFANNSNNMNIPQKDLIGKCITFAELPQILHKTAFCLRVNRKY